MARKNASSTADSPTSTDVGGPSRVTPINLPGIPGVLSPQSNRGLNSNPQAVPGMNATVGDLSAAVGGPMDPLGRTRPTGSESEEGQPSSKGGRGKKASDDSEWVVVGAPKKFQLDIQNVHHHITTRTSYMKVPGGRLYLVETTTFVSSRGESIQTTSSMSFVPD